jgi:hypothetical protein
MSKDLQWFKFSPLNWMTGRIRRESAKTQVAFMELICQYWKNSCCMTREQAELEIGDSLSVLIKKQLVKMEGENIRIGFLDVQMVDIGATGEKRSNAAKSRWIKEHSKTMQVHASALQDYKGAIQNDAEKRREEKTREIYQSPKNAFDDITGNYIETESHRNIVANKGWRAATKLDTDALLFHFLESQVDFSTQSHTDVKNHFRRWLNKQPIENLQSLTQKIHERTRQQA